MDADDPGREATEIRRLGPDDYALAREAIQQLKAVDNRGLPDADHLRRFLARPENVLIVASRGATPVGFALAYILDRVDRDEKMVMFYEIEVAATDRRRGIGREMVETLKGVCRTAPTMKMWVLTDRSNTPAMKLYESTGGQTNSHHDDVCFVYSSDRFA
jgi:ribosomal protein S18 acetylase RimI-like enzyme